MTTAVQSRPGACEACLPKAFALRRAPRVDGSRGLRSTRLHTALSTQAVVLCTRAADTGFCPPGASGSNGRPSSPDPFPVGTATIHMSYRSRAPETDSRLQAIVHGPGGRSAVPLAWAAYPYENDKVAHVLVPPPGGGAPSVAAAADATRPADAEDAVTSISAGRRLRRRLRPVRAVLLALVTRLPALDGCAPSITAIRARLGVTRALVALREIARSHLGSSADAHLPDRPMTPASRVAAVHAGATVFHRGSVRSAAA